MTRTKTSRMKRTTSSLRNQCAARFLPSFLPSFLPASCSAGRFSADDFSNSVSTVGLRCARSAGVVHSAVATEQPRAAPTWFNSPESYRVTYLLGPTAHPTLEQANLYQIVD